jgi:hypothetical protein
MSETNHNCARLSLSLSIEFSCRHTPYASRRTRVLHCAGDGMLWDWDVALDMHVHMQVGELLTASPDRNEPTSTRRRDDVSSSYRQ